MSLRYGLVGLGNVGTELTRGAVAAGLDLTVYDQLGERVDEATAAGASAATDVTTMARDVDVLVLSLPNTVVVDNVLTSGDVMELLGAGAFLVDMSTNLPQRAAELAAAGSEEGLRVLDAPVSFGPEGLVSFVGGHAEDFAALRPWFDAVTVHTSHVGPAGHGQHLKLLQNMLSGVHMGIVAEALGLAERAGLDTSSLGEHLRRTGAYSPLLERVLPAMANREYRDTGTMALHAKDMAYAIDTAAALDAPTPFTSTLHRVFTDLLSEGNPRWNQTALIEYFAPKRHEG
jgi:3-hydroxyisobutyrate dehydrogenase-like beta-hydroxyacid dehydrogenase